ncbi:N-terminal ig-like domain of cellulase [Actinopolyspora lacussalsi subsp. righensis]|uniref:N-terminal ig-like domain of cellulase n=1 Tax=Actinopolyspora righensis TaxID=995060 RepID=A0A1I7C0E8_9ACTN|nr:glycoside hydrolase family 9 protein [Actinopolyspora righensis]SFT92875.1 N-terminal ig-like domain of cellulase [Actinopolyspora righensis]
MSGMDRRRFLAGSAAVSGGTAVGALTGTSAAAEPGPEAGQERGHDRVLVHVNNVGHDPESPKTAVLAAGDREPIAWCFLVDNETGEIAARRRPHHAGRVRDWGETRYWTVDFSEFTVEGEYVLRVGAGNHTRGESVPFRIEPLALERDTLSDVVHWFKSARCSGRFDRADHSLPVGENGSGDIDAHGGWYDATGDFGKHFTQLSRHSYFNTLSVPLTAWVLFKAHEQLTARDNEEFTQLRTWLCDEGLYGADYLNRVKRPEGTFCHSVMQPGPPKDPALRFLKTTEQDGEVRQVNHREGAGAAIAALALASTSDDSGEYDSAEYLRTAETAFEYLREHNVELTNDGVENIQDDYNALIAAVELHRVIGKNTYREAADARADNLMNRLSSWRSYRDYWRADDGDRPYFHPSDAGLPVTSLLSYLDIADSARTTRVLEVVRRSLSFEMSITTEVTNPYGYARNLVQDGTGDRHSSFFFPHDVTPRPGDEWWQGENARIASLATAARLAAKRFDGEFAGRLRRYAADQLDWILGRNPFGVCMLGGSGRNNPRYMWKGSWQFLNTAGGIVNGITGENADGSGISWNRGYAETGKDWDWRWTEQWLPHTTWYLFAVSVG